MISIGGGWATATLRLFPISVKETLTHPLFVQYFRTTAREPGVAIPPRSLRAVSGGKNPAYPKRHTRRVRGAEPPAVDDGL